MGKLSFLSKLKNLFKLKPTTITSITDATGKVVKTITQSKVVTKVLTVGNAVGVAVVGFVGYYIFNGGLIKATSDILGIPDWLSTVLWIAGVLILIFFGIKFLSNFIKRSTSKKRYYR